MTVNNSTNRRIERRKNAEQLGVHRAKRTSTQQLELLDRRLGIGEGAKRERDRLYEKSAEKVAAVDDAPTVTEEETPKKRNKKAK